MNNDSVHLAVSLAILSSGNSISKNYLEDDVIIVQNINAQRPWGEEWQSLDQSLRLEENPTSLARKNPILFGRRSPTCSWQVALFQQTTRNTFMTLKHVQKVFSFVQTEDPLARYWGPMQLLWQEIQFLFHLYSLPLRHFLELGELATRRFLGKRQKIRLQDSALPLNWTFILSFFKTFAIIPKFYLPYLSIEFF